MSQVIRGVLFDKDGTLIDFQQSWGPVMDLVADEIGGGHRELAVRLLRVGGHDPVTGQTAPGSLLAAGTAVEVAEAWAPLLGTDDVAGLAVTIDAGFRRYGPDYAVPVPHLTPTLDTLAQRELVLGVATSDSEGAALDGLERLGLLRRFRFICGFDSGHGTKPGPGMVLGFCAATGLSPDQVAVVGDNTHDLEMASAAGAGLRVGVLTGTGRPAELAPLADVILPGVAELPAALDAWTGRAGSPAR